MKKLLSLAGRRDSGFQPVNLDVLMRDLITARLDGMNVNAASGTGRFACLEVVDNGPGMDEPTLRHVFTPFFTTKKTGHGLGLAAVEGIVRGHHGALRVDSVVGRGSRFSVWFPIASEHD